MLNLCLFRVGQSCACLAPCSRIYLMCCCLRPLMSRHTYICLRSCAFANAAVEHVIDHTCVYCLVFEHVLDTTNQMHGHLAQVSGKTHCPLHCESGPEFTRESNYGVQDQTLAVRNSYTSKPTHHLHCFPSWGTDVRVGNHSDIICVSLLVLRAALCTACTSSPLHSARESSRTTSREI